MRCANVAPCNLSFRILLAEVAPVYVPQMLGESEF